MKNKKIILAAIAFLALVGAMLALYFVTRPETDAHAKQITVTVVYPDGKEKIFTYETKEAFLGPVLYKEGLVAEDKENPGMFDTVDGVKAVWPEGYWALYLGQDYATKGIDATPIYDGDSFRLVYTPG